MNRHRATLDRLLAQRGEEIALRRQVGTTNTSYVECRCMAYVRGLEPDELIGGIDQTNWIVVISFSDIERQQWPGGKPPRNVVSGQVLDDGLPAANDKVFLRGSVKNVEAVNPIFVGGECVRIEMRVKG